MDFKDDAFSVSVMDEGNGIPEMPEAPDIDKKIEELETPRGLGIYLMKQLTDQVDFNAQGDGHVVRMVIKLRG
jgi:anti-sigma regulatory factor (Ser/Thr protein kinase)